MSLSASPPHVLIITTYLLQTLVLLVLPQPPQLALPHVLLALDSTPQDPNVSNALLSLQETALLQLA